MDWIGPQFSNEIYTQSKQNSVIRVPPYLSICAVCTLLRIFFLDTSDYAWRKELQIITTYIKQFSKIITDFETAFLSTAFPTSASRPAPASARPALRPLIGLSGLPSNQFITNDGQACRCLSRVTTTHHPQHTVPKVIVFPRYNSKCGGGNEKLRGIFSVVSQFPLNFVLYLGNLDYFFVQYFSLSYHTIQSFSFPH